jgi:crotonobetainyl-CoA:carnitine CoA-transferase CaiB-like acyl-CoA transferase
MSTPKTSASEDRSEARARTGASGSRGMCTAALDGVVVVDFSRVLAGPYATMLLGDFGADVIKIERPTIGDDTREWGPPYDSDGVATYFNAINRNKRSVVLDLTDPADVARARELVAGADIVVENFRPGTMEKLGLGYDTLRTLRPDLIYCAITGFGRDGGADLPGYDLLVQAVGGLMSITGPEPGEPTKVGVAVVDVLAGLHAVAGILIALAHRDRTGQGQRVDTDLLSVLLSSMVNQASGYLGAGSVPAIMGNRHPSIAPYQTFSTADRPIAVAVGNDKQFMLLAHALDLPGLVNDERFASNALRVRNRDALCDILIPVLKTQGTEHWYALLTSVGVPTGPINDMAEAFDFAEKLGLTVTAAVPGSPTPQVANPISMSVTPPEYRSAPPRLGRDTHR